MKSSIDHNIPFIVQGLDSEHRKSNSASYFHYPAVVQRIKDTLQQRFSTSFQLYEEDNQDLWHALEEDIRSGYPGVEHCASLFDLASTRTFSYVQEAGFQSAYHLRPSVLNNLFLYPEYCVAFARIPYEMHYGLGHEELIFAENDDCMRMFLEHIRKRQLSEGKVHVFTDTDDGLEQERKGAMQDVTRDDVFMEDSLKTHIYRSVDEFFSKDGAFFRQYGIPYKRGILLYGKPGNGKTTLVKSIATTVKAPIAYWQITEYTSSDSIKEVFAAAMKMAPMVLVIEDIDSMPESCRSYFLNTLDGASSKEGIFLIGTTNYPERIDPALMNRAGRFDRAYEVKSPVEQQRHAYLIRKGLGGFLCEEQVDAAAELTEGFTYAQLGELYVSAALQMHYESEVQLEGLIAEMKSDFSKGHSGDWISKERSRTLGFV
ncbi:ATP-binding protein [Paenibacillus sp. J5C_2022]|uniref:ATP-binding protein n=1 Tax=Paenibacillus sp. J5C2022 TaxID=2977129 RepID=UPI0021D3DB0A|nr:ATP-binding protein [Paenibacillus sp. J5C2022]MCU6708640.1 ATP-binding protein [Paenibacillus sp. J5C2022]